VQPAEQASNTASSGPTGSFDWLCNSEAANNASHIRPNQWGAGPDDRGFSDLVTCRLSMSWRFCIGVSKSDAVDEGNNDQFGTNAFMPCRHRRITPFSSP